MGSCVLQLVALLGNVVEHTGGRAQWKSQIMEGVPLKEIARPQHLPFVVLQPLWGKWVSSATCFHGDVPCFHGPKVMEPRDHGLTPLIL